MKNMDKGLTVQKWVMMVQPKMPQMPQNLSAQFVRPSPKFLDLNEKKASLGVRSSWSPAAAVGLGRVMVVADTIKITKKTW
jgi:hypothetical protein